MTKNVYHPLMNGKFDAKLVFSLEYFHFFHRKCMKNEFYPFTYLQIY